MNSIISDILSRKDGKKTKGFTLIELLVVVVIIGILAAIATPIYLNQRKAAWKATAISDVSTGTLAVESARTQAPDGSLSGVEFGGGQDGAPMTITLGGETTRATVSPGNTETAWTGKTADGEECYAVMTTNKNVGSDWAAVRTSVSGQLTTGTPPANGSTECPRPASPAPAPTKPAACDDIYTGDLLINASQTISYCEITGSLEIAPAVALTAPNLISVGGEIRFGSSAGVNDGEALTAPTLTTIGTNLWGGVKTLSLPALKSIGGTMEIYGHVDAPALTTIGGDYYNQESNSTPKLSSVNGQPYPAA